MSSLEILSEKMPGAGAAEENTTGCVNKAVAAAAATAIGDARMRKKFVSVSCRSLIKPSRQAPCKYCDLITFDLPYVTFHYNQKILVFPAACDSDSSSMSSMEEALKSSLSEALAYFYPLAGKLCMKDGILMVDCNDDGAEFIEAFSENLCAQDVCRSDCEAALMREFVPYNKTDNLYGSVIPLLGVQVTKLKDGVVLGVSVNHVIADGYSTWYFMNVWSQICRGNTAATSISLQQLPTHNRSSIRNTKLNLQISLPNAVDPAKADDQQPEAESDAPLKTKIFHFGKDVMDSLKSKANSNRPKEQQKPYSYFQSLGAHVWKSVTRSRNLKPQDITVFTLFIDCRNRLNPAVEKNYFGNVIQGIYGATAAGIVMGGELSAVADMLQKVIEGHTREAIEAKNSEWESNPKLYDFSDAGLNSVTVGSSPRFDVYALDFGYGQPIRVRSGPNNKFDGMVNLYPAANQGSGSGSASASIGAVDVEITLHADALRNLELDPLFLVPAA